MEAEPSRSPESLAIVVIGTDAMIEALPARPIQLANACGELGFDLAIPLSWGDELVAEAAIRSIQTRGDGPLLLCTCPLARRRLLHAGTDLADAMISLVSPPVALARHLRASLGARLTSLSFIGHCPGAEYPDYDANLTPDEFFRLLHRRGIELARQADSFFDRLPADRRRFVSLPGGCPTPEVLWQRCNERVLVEIESADFSIEVAERLLSSERVLVDVGLAVGCLCSGVTPTSLGHSARIAAASLEPPRSTTPVINDAVVADLEMPVSAAPRPRADIESSESAAPTGRTRMAVTPSAALRVPR